jgi:ubiquinone/menaquinone biosynthesis C-methylase UbiE
MDSKNYFDSVATNWDSMRQGFFGENLRKKAFEVAQIQQGKIAADIGAGTGFLTEGLIQRGLRVIAVDRSKAMLEVLKSKLPPSAQIDCRTGEAENLPIGDNHVDYVFANMYLHHVVNPHVAIKEMVRILKPGGMLVITDMDEHSFAFLKAEHHDRWMGFKRKDVHRWLEEADLKEIRVICADEQCCAESDCGNQQAQVSIFIASGTKPDALD